MVDKRGGLLDNAVSEIREGERNVGEFVDRRVPDVEEVHSAEAVNEVARESTGTGCSRDCPRGFTGANTRFTTKHSRTDTSRGRRGLSAYRESR